MTMTKTATDRAWMVVVFAVVSAVSPCKKAGGQVAAPPGWRWITDQPAGLTAGDTLGDSLWHFTQMPPGWHITTRPAAVMYDPGHLASGNFVIESTQVLFPGASQSGYGVFIGGRGLEFADAKRARYVAFLIRRDGAFSVESDTGAETVSLVPWKTVSAVKRAPPGDATVTNTLRVAVAPDSIRVSMNGERIAAVPRGDLQLDGHFGFRTGADLNLHVTTLDYTQRLAPTPKR